MRGLTAAEAAPLLDAVTGETINETTCETSGETTGTVAVAVSGGPDSTALLLVSHAWAEARGRRLEVLTVDHRLRAASGCEAAAVAALCARLGLAHTTLTWTGKKPVRGLPAAARRARYRLMLEACHRLGAGVLLLGHHRDDQVETILHRLSRDSGPFGLAGMASGHWMQGVRLARPFLAIEKRRLEATCLAAGLAPVRDPTNADRRYTRARLRAMRDALDEVGLSAERLIRLAAGMRRMRTAIEAEIARRLERFAVIGSDASVRFERTAFAAAPPVLRRYLMRRMLTIAGGEGYPPRTRALERLIGWMASAEPGSVRTLAGCVIALEAGAILVCREVAACAGPLDLAPGARGCWDGRFLVENRGRAPVRVAACGVRGWRRMRIAGVWPAAQNAETGLPHRARLAHPVVLDLDGGMTVPHLVTRAGGLSTILQGCVHLWAVSGLRDRFEAET